MKKRIAQIVAVALSFSMIAGFVAQQNTNGAGEGDSYAYWVESPGSWNLDAGGPMVNSEFNTTLHQDVIQRWTARDGGIFKHNVNDIYGPEVGKAIEDTTLSDAFYVLQNYNLTPDSMFGGGLSDYKYMRDHGYIMTPETSYYWGIRATEKLDMKKSEKRKVRTENTPVHYGKMLQTNQRTATYADGTPGSRVNEYAYFVKPVWTSSNEDVATVDKNGNVKAVGKGKAKINVKYTIWTMDSKIQLTKDGQAIKAFWADSGDKVMWGTGPFHGKGWTAWGTMAFKYDVKRTCNVTVK